MRLVTNHGVRRFKEHVREELREMFLGDFDEEVRFFEEFKKHGFALIEGGLCGFIYFSEVYCVMREDFSGVLHLCNVAVKDYGYVLKSVDETSIVWGALYVALNELAEEHKQKQEA